MFLTAGSILGTIFLAPGVYILVHDWGKNRKHIFSSEKGEAANARRGACKQDHTPPVSSAPSLWPL